MIWPKSVFLHHGNGIYPDNLKYIQNKWFILNNFYLFYNKTEPTLMLRVLQSMMFEDRKEYQPILFTDPDHGVILKPSFYHVALFKGML